MNRGWLNLLWVILVGDIIVSLPSVPKDHHSQSLMGARVEELVDTYRAVGDTIHKLITITNCCSWSRLRIYTNLD